MLFLRSHVPTIHPPPHRRSPATLQSPRQFEFGFVSHNFPSVFTLRCRSSPSDSQLVAEYGDGWMAVDAAFEEELRRLLVLLPQHLRQQVEIHPELYRLVEVVMDLGRKPLARFPSGDFILSERAITAIDLHHAILQVGEFSADNRAGISRTLHRISAIRNRKGTIIGLTCRVGRAITGSAKLLRDLVQGGDSLLLIGPPGVGKTTIIREIARTLADDFKRRVMIVDTSNEIGGDGDIPHPGIGNARRLQVPNSDMQHKVLIEAVENHMPEVIIIDEIGTKLEAMAASTIAQRGIQLVATAHGVTIENLIMNPSLDTLVGGIQSVTLGDEEASRRRVQKTVLERKGPPTFVCGAEIINKTELRVHHSLEGTVDALLAGRSAIFEVRRISSSSSLDQPGSVNMDILAHMQDETLAEGGGSPKNEVEKAGNNLQFLEASQVDVSRRDSEDISLHIYGISEKVVLQALKQLGVDVTILLTDDLLEADAILALHSKIKKNLNLQDAAARLDLPLFVTKTSSLTQVSKALWALVNKHFPKNRVSATNPEVSSSSSEATDALEAAGHHLLAG